VRCFEPAALTGGNSISAADQGVTPIVVRKIWQEGAWPCYSPDGKQLVFTGALDQPNNRLMVMDANGLSSPRSISPLTLNAKRPSWLSSDEIVFNRDQQSIWSIRIPDGHLRPFLHEVPEGSPPFFHPCAYPNERAVVVVGFSNTDLGRSGVLYKLTPDDREPLRPLTRFPEVCAGRPGVSPEGKTVVFTGNKGCSAQGANQLWLVREGESARRLEPGEPAMAQGRSPRWSPDGNRLVWKATLGR
jgi:Tol biopolymer transport system component